MPFGMAVNTPKISTGNVRTTYDPIVAAQTAAGVGVVPGYVYQNQAQPFGTTFMDIGGSDSVSGTTTQLPVGQVAVYKYVLYKSTTNPAVIGVPGLVYYTDNTGLVVSGSPTDGFIGATTAGSASDLAGIMMVNSGDLTTLTATLLNNGTSGSGVWICIGGFVKAANCASATVAGDFLIGNTTTSGTQWASARIAAAGTVTAQRLLGIALTSKATVNTQNACDVDVTMSSIAPY
jgi:hypothetical protein